MSNYCFPELEANNISQYMKDNYGDIGFSDKDLTHPQRRNWQKYYIQMFLDSSLNLSTDMINQMPITSEFCYPEMHEEAVSLLNIVCCMRPLMASCGIHDFKMSDIIGPYKPRRLARLCSALINFRRFQEERLMTFHALKSEDDARHDQRQGLSQTNEEIKMKINTHKKQQAEKEEDIKVIEGMISEWDEKIQAHQQNIGISQKNSSENKFKIAERNSNIAQQKEQNVQAKQENASLASKIVLSPERLRGERERQERQLAQSQHQRDTYEKRQMDCKQRLQEQQLRFQAHDLTMRSFEAIQEQIETQRFIKRKIAYCQEEVSNKKTEIKQLDGKSQQLTSQVSIRKEKLEKAAMLKNMKMNEIKLTMEEKQKECKILWDVFGEMDDQIQRVQAEIKKVKTQERENFIDYQEKMQKMSNMYQEILKQLDHYHEGIGASYHKLADVFIRK